MSADAGRSRIGFRLNGAETALTVAHDESLVETLRDQLHLTSVRGTCGLGICGTCTVLLDGKVASSCIMLTRQVEGREVTTSEGLLDGDGELHAVQAAFVANNAYQCSFCIPAMVLTVSAYLDEHPDDGDLEGAREYLGGNLCRCGSYPEILAAIGELLDARQEGVNDGGA